MAQLSKMSSVEYAFRENDESFAESPWEYDPASGGISASPSNGYLRFAVNNQTGRNLWCKYKNSSPHQLYDGGLNITFRIRMTTVSGSEAKCNFPSDIILRATDDGRSFNYTHWTGSFNQLAESAVKPDGKWHVLTQVIQKTGVTLYEDGVRLFEWKRDMPDAIELMFSNQLLDIGASFCYDLSNVRCSPLSYTSLPTTLVWTPELDLSNTALFVHKPNDNGPQMVPMDGFVRFQNDNQTGDNQWVNFKLVQPLTMTGGSSMNLRLRMNSSRSSEVKLQLACGVIVRWTNAGSSAQYCYWTGSFQALAPCAAVKETGWNDISMIMFKDCVTLFENGVRLFDWKKENEAEEEVHFDFQVLDANTSTSVDISDVGFNNGIMWKA